MNVARLIRFVACAALAAAALGAGATAVPALGGYQFCEAPGPGPRAFVSQVFGGGADPHASFERYLTARYRLHDVHARCFRLGSEHEANAFRTQRIELLHWDGWQHVVATSWTPDSTATVAGADH